VVDEAVIQRLFALVRLGKAAEELEHEVHQHNACRSFESEVANGDHDLFRHARDKNGNTLLMEATRLRKLHLVQYIIDSYPDCVNIANLEGVRSFLFYHWFNSVQIV
jgi:hypothetical protein